MERLRLLLLVILLAFVAMSCNTANSDCYEFPYDSPFVGFIADTSGHIEQHFPIESPDHALNYLISARLTRMKQDWLGASWPFGAAIFDLQRRRLVYAIEEFQDNTFITGPSSRLYKLEQQINSYSFSNNIVIYNRLLESRVMALTVDDQGNVDNRELFALKIRKTAANRFETDKVVLLFPVSDSQFFYFRDYEVTSVRTDSSGEEVHVNRFYYERSLWQYNSQTDEHTRLLQLPEPANKGAVDGWDGTPDGRYLAYEDGGTVYLVDTRQLTVQKVNERDRNSWLKRPIISPDAAYILAYSRSSDYSIYDLSTDEHWPVLNQSSYISGPPSFASDRRYLYYPNKRNDTLGIWKVPVDHSIWEKDENDENESLVISVTDLFDLPKERLHLANLGQVLPLKDGKLFFIGTFTGLSYGCQ